MSANYNTVQYCILFAVGCVLCFQLKGAFAAEQLLGTWEGSAKVVRSDLYGGTREEQPVKTVYTAEGDIVKVVSG